MELLKYTAIYSIPFGNLVVSMAAVPVSLVFRPRSRNRIVSATGILLFALLHLICYWRVDSFSLTNHPLFRKISAMHKNSVPRMAMQNVLSPNTEMSLNNSRAISEYEGPLPSFEMMEAGCLIEDLGLEVLVGTSVDSSRGRGLFIALQEGVEEVILPRGTPICGYCRGTFSDEGLGDKTVAYAFSAMETGVVFNKTIYSILDLVNLYIDKVDDFIRLVDGQELYYDANADEIRK